MFVKLLFFSFLRTLIYAMLALFCAGASYVWLNYKSHRIVCVVLIAVIITILFFVLRLALITFYDYLIDRKRKKIRFYTDRKKSIIEDVKENEKFKVAKEIIEKYSSNKDLDELLKSNHQTSIGLILFFKKKILLFIF